MGVVTYNCPTSPNTREQYGFIKGAFAHVDFLPIKQPNQIVHPHYNFTIRVHNQNYRANINIQSKNKQYPTLKVFTTTNFKRAIENKKPFLRALRLPCGVYQINQMRNAMLALDYLRGQYFALEQLTLFEACAHPEQAYNDLYTCINQAFANAQTYQAATIGLWGKIYQNPATPTQPAVAGIHDIHMNQGVPNSSTNAVWQDGACMIMHGKQIKLLMFFAFANQCLTTDQCGNCLKPADQ